MSPDEQPAPVSTALAVRATETGRYLSQLRSQGKVFELAEAADFDATWMEWVTPPLQQMPGLG